jgi:hypothetical protein
MVDTNLPWIAEPVHLSKSLGEILLERAGTHRGRRVQKVRFHSVGSQSAWAFNIAGGIGVMTGLDSISPMAARKAPRTWRTISAADIKPHRRSSQGCTAASRFALDRRSSLLPRVGARSANLAVPRWVMISLAFRRDQRKIEPALDRAVLWLHGPIAVV